MFCYHRTLPKNPKKGFCVNPVWKSCYRVSCVFLGVGKTFDNFRVNLRTFYTKNLHTSHQKLAYWTSSWVELLKVHTIITHEVARKIFLRKVSFRSSDFGGAYRVSNIWQIGSNLTFSCNFFKCCCANKLVWYLFKPLPVATRFNLSLWVLWLM